MTQNSFPKIEDEILKFWQDSQIFKKTIEKPSPNGQFIFYDGPPFATGLPHYGHIIASAMKDVIPRYKTMRGFRVNRRWGWDCHGLPIENLIEKELNLKTKKDIEKLGIDKFNAECQKSVLRYADEWKKFIPRMARWVDMENDYRTMDNRYIEVIWWIFKKLYSQGLIYEGYKPMHLCPRCETTLSNFEVTLGYRDVQDEAVYVKFKLKTTVQNSNLYLLAWTTTPWTLPGNMALAVGEDIGYWILDIGSNKSGIRDKDYYIVAKERVKELMRDREYEVVDEINGLELVGLEYEPLFNVKCQTEDVKWKNVFQVYPADFVSTEEGTGIVHIAPAFGEDDYELSKQVHLPMLQHVNKDGTVKDEIVKLLYCYIDDKKQQFSNLTIEQLNKEVVKYLEDKNLLFNKETITHSYPHCWRCDTRLLNYVASSWFVKIDDNFQERLLKANAAVNWVPEHLKDGRFGKWLEGARDWAISRSRYWGAPLPVWRCQNCQNVKVIGSIAELNQNKISDKESEILDSSEGSFPLGMWRDCHLKSKVQYGQNFVKSQKKKKPAEGFEPSVDRVTIPPQHQTAGISLLYQKNNNLPIDLHRPYIDEIVLQCAKCQGEMHRVKEVFDCWFESGAMPYASEIMFSDYQLTPQTTCQDLLKQISFPADFIAEGIDQTRGWFYTLLVLGVALYDKSPFKNVAVNGIILAEDGQKMSKRLKNYPDPQDIINKYGADAMRFYLMSSPAVRGESLNFSEKGVEEVYKKIVLLTLNVLKFWEVYVDSSKFKVQSSKLQLKIQNLENVLDQWILARIEQLIMEVGRSLDNYEIDKACRLIVEFVDDLSNWYLRRSRGRFKSQKSKVKSQNYELKCKSKAIDDPVVVLGYVLLEFSKILAPICPFLAEYVYQQVSSFKFQVSSKESVHLENWPVTSYKLQVTSYKLLDIMQTVRQICEIGHSLRAEAGIKVRQPLKKFQVSSFKFQEELTALIQDELNVKEVKIVDKLPEGEGWISKNGVALYTVIDDELKEEGIVRELTRQINNLRKKQGLTIEDRISLEYATDSEHLRQIIEKYQQELMRAVLGREIVCQKSLDGERVMVEGEEVVVKLGN